MADKNAPKTSTASLADNNSDVNDFPEYPPALLPVVGVPWEGVMTGILRGPEYDFGQGPVRPLILTLRMTEGEAMVSRDKPNETYHVAGKVMSLWLIHGVLETRLKEELKPKPGERIRGRFDGERQKKSTNKGDKNSTYNAWSVFCPDRAPEIESVSNWD